MSPVFFFRTALLLPTLVPLAFLQFKQSVIGEVLIMSLAFGGAQYIIFAAYLFYWVGRVQNPNRIRRISYLTPLYFIPVQAIGWIIASYFDKSNPALIDIWKPLIVFSAYILVVGYAYVGIVNILYLAIFKSKSRAVEP